MSEDQRLFDVLFLDTLDSEVWERAAHRLCELHGAHPLLATLLPNQVVRMGSVRGITGDTGHNHNRPPLVAGHLDCGERPVFQRGRGSWDAAGAATLALVAEPQAFACGLLDHGDVGRLLHLVQVAAARGGGVGWRGHRVRREIAGFVARAQNINCGRMRLDLKITSDWISPICLGTLHFGEKYIESWCRRFR